MQYVDNFLNKKQLFTANIEFVKQNGRVKMNKTSSRFVCGAETPCPVTISRFLISVSLRQHSSSIAGHETAVLEF